MLERITVFLINIFCPPLSVLFIAGAGTDCLINTLLFIAGVLPGHLHGFYISCTYFSRKRKVRKGRYPGGRKSFIYSRRIINGGASDDKVRDLWREKCRAEEGDGRGSMRSSGRGEMRKSDVVERAWDGRRESKKVCSRKSVRNSAAY